MMNNKFPMTLKEAAEKYKEQGLTVKVFRRLIKDKLIGSDRRKNKLYVSGHDIKKYLGNRDGETISGEKFSAQDKDRVKVLNDVEALRQKRLKNEAVVNEIIEQQKGFFFQALNEILSGLPDLPHRLYFTPKQKGDWNIWIKEVSGRVEEESKRITALKTWRQIVDQAEPLQKDVK